MRWPSQRDLRERLRTTGRARLLLVEDGTPPPSVTDLAEDWIRLPADPVDVQARLAGLTARIANLNLDVPRIDSSGIMRFGGRHSSLPPLEARLAAVLVDHFRSVTSRAELTAAGWPNDEPGRNALDVHILRLRRRLEPLGLRLRTVRSRGYLLETASGLDKLAVPKL